MQIIKAVPTNIVTGALGVGKTTLIQKLLSQKPDHERWAVLINEFGEIGMDAALLQGSIPNTQKDTANKSIYIREVPGGCMCCTSGITMQIALNQLLAAAKPHRLVIEPTGLGHPKEVIQILGSEYYKDLIKLENTLCLVDARKLANERWCNHQTFKEQFEVADKVVITKSDLYKGNELQQLNKYLHDLHLSTVELIHSDKGQIDISLLDKPLALSDILPLADKFKASMLLKVGVNKTPQTSALPTSRLVVENEQNEAGIMHLQSLDIVRKEKDSEGFHSRGWRWPAEHWFDYTEVVALIESLEVVRLKAIMITIKGIFSFNVLDGEIHIKEHDEAFDSRLELITASEFSTKQADQKIETFIRANSLI